MFAQNSNSINSQILHLDFRNLSDSIHQLPEEALSFEGIDYPQLHRVIGGTAISFTLLNTYLNTSYWNGSSGFISKDEVGKYGYIDKAGYFYLSNLMTHILSASLESANMDYEDTYIYGALGAGILGTYLEIRDGYSNDRVFGRSDFVSTLLGSGYALSQYYFPILKEIQPRISYVPSGKGGRGDRVTPFNDLLGQKYWLGFRLNKLLPEKIAEYWPSFLMISIGTGISGYDYTNVKNDIYLALDFDAEEIPLHGSFWQFIKNTLNYFHFPLPGIRVTNGIAFFGLCY